MIIHSCHCRKINIYYLKNYWHDTTLIGSQSASKLHTDQKKFNFPSLKFFNEKSDATTKSNPRVHVAMEITFDAYSVKASPIKHEYSTLPRAEPGFHHLFRFSLFISTFQLRFFILPRADAPVPAGNNHSGCNPLLASGAINNIILSHVHYLSFYFLFYSFHTNWR